MFVVAKAPLSAGLCRLIGKVKLLVFRFAENRLAVGGAGGLGVLNRWDVCGGSPGDEEVEEGLDELALTLSSDGDIEPPGLARGLSKKLLPAAPAAVV